jgi:hypothetical protein
MSNPPKKQCDESAPPIWRGVVDDPFNGVGDTNKMGRIGTISSGTIGESRTSPDPIASLSTIPMGIVGSAMF